MKEIGVFMMGLIRIDRRKRERGVTGRRDRKSANIIIANDNYAPEMAMAA